MSLLKEKIELKVAEAELETQRAMLNFSPLQRKFLIFCVIAVIPAYYIAKTVAFNATAGSLQKFLITAQPSFTAALDLQTANAIITQAGNNYAAAIAITNKNLDVSLEQIPYRLVFSNAAGQQVYTTPRDFLFILPGQSKYIFAPRINTKQQIVSGKIIFPDGVKWQKRLSIPKVSLEAGTPTFGNQNNPIAFAVTGTVFNNSPYRLGEARIGYLLRSASGAVIASSQRSEFNLAPHERRAYTQLWPGIYSQDVTRVEVLPETDTLNNRNITLPQDAVTPSSDLGRPDSKRP